MASYFLCFTFWYLTISIYYIISYGYKVYCQLQQLENSIFCLFYVEKVILTPAVVGAVVVTRGLQQGEHRPVELHLASSLQSLYKESLCLCIFDSDTPFFIYESFILMLFKYIYIYIFNKQMHFQRTHFDSLWFGYLHNNVKQAFITAKITS